MRRNIRGELISANPRSKAQSRLNETTAFRNGIIQYYRDRHKETQLIFEQSLNLSVYPVPLGSDSMIELYLTELQNVQITDINMTGKIP